MYLTKPVHFFLMVVVVCFFCYHAKGQSALILQEKQRLLTIKDSQSYVNSLNRIGILYDMENPDSCFHYGMKAKTMAVRLHYEKGIAEADNVTGVAFYLRGFYKESLELLNKSLSAYRQQADTANVMQIIMNMGVVYESLNDSTKARSFYWNAIRTGLNLKQDSIMSLAYTDYAQFNDQLAVTKRLAYLDKAYKIACQYKDERMQIMVRQVRATIFLTHGRRPEAFEILKQSLTEAKKAGIGILQINAYGRLSGFYEGQPDSVARFANLGYQLAQRNGYSYLKIRILKYILYNTGKTFNKLETDSIHRLLEGALMEENSNLKKFIGDYIKYNTIQEDNRELEVSNKNNQAKIWLLTGICIIILLSGVFIYRQYHIYRDLNLRVNEQNSQMQKTLIALEQSQADNTRMMHIAAHDLRNPIGGVTTAASLMLEDHSRPLEDREMLELIKKSGQNSLELVSDLLQLQTRSGEMKKEPVELLKMLNYCVGLLHFKAEAKGQRISLQGAPLTAPVNEEKLWRVISNLITNAIKFSPRGATVVVQLEKKPDVVVISVEDHGIGIPEEIKNRIFDTLSVPKRPGTAGEQSFGLGLSISKQIVEAHNGRIWFESKVGNGTVFYVELPLS